MEGESPKTRWQRREISLGGNDTWAKEARIVSYYMVRSQQPPLNRGYKFLGPLSYMFKCFMLFRDNEGAQPSLPYSGGVLEQPYFETMLWDIFNVEVHKKVEEDHKKMMQKSNARMR